MSTASVQSTCQHCGKTQTKVYWHPRGRWVCVDSEGCADRWLARQSAKSETVQSQLLLGAGSFQEAH